jgi:DNA-nicking Smr family endonuclease
MKKKPAPRDKIAKKASEPFFRPFSKLPKKQASSPGEDGEARRRSGESGAPKKSANPPSKQGASERTEPERAPPVDPATFAVYMAGVKALEERPSRIPRTANRLERAAQPVLSDDPDAGARAKLRSLVAEGIRFETIDDGERIEGRRQDVDPRDLRRLRRALFAVDGKLDLHGLSAVDARAAVEAFVKKRAEAGDVCVLVVHGKGNHSPRGVSVLRGEIAAWLTQGKLSRHVRAFASAPEAAPRSGHEGSGAVLVLLAR